MKIYWIILISAAAVIAAAAIFLTVRKLLYVTLDKRIANFQSSLIENFSTMPLRAARS